MVLKKLGARATFLGARSKKKSTCNLIKRATTGALKHHWSTGESAKENAFNVHVHVHVDLKRDLILVKCIGQKSSKGVLISLSTMP